MRHIVVLTCIMTIFLQCCYSQQINSADSLSRAKAKDVSNFIADKTLNNNHLLFSIGDKWYLMVVEHRDYYEEFYFQVDTLLKCSKINPIKIDKPNNILEKAFDKDLYHKDFINLNSNFYKTGYEISEGNTTYFYFKDKDGNVYGESKLTTLIKPNPINNEVYNHLLMKLLQYITPNGSEK